MLVIYTLTENISAYFRVKHHRKISDKLVSTMTLFTVQIFIGIMLLNTIAYIKFPISKLSALSSPILIFHNQTNSY